MEPDGWAPYVAAIAAVIAAVLTAVNLWVTGRREQRTWVRSALESAFVDLLTASYHHRDACRLIVESHQGGILTQDTDKQWHAEAAEARRVMLDCVSRLRVLASSETANLAQRVIQHNEYDMELIQAGRFEEFQTTRSERKNAFNADRDKFTDRAVRLLDIPAKEPRPRR